MMRKQPPNSTLAKFGYPEMLVHEGTHWALLVRPTQPTLGSLILCTKGDEQSYGALSSQAFVEQSRLVAGIELALSRFVHFERINYLMLMMVDPHVHFHVIPRYEGERQFGGMHYRDNGWPGIPDLGKTQPACDALVHALREAWQEASKEEGGY